MQHSTVTLTVAYVLLSIYLGLLFISIVCIRKERFVLNGGAAAGLLNSLVPCFDATTSFATPADAYNAGKMFKYAPIKSDPGTCFYYTTPGSDCAGLVNGLNYKSKRFNHGLGAGDAMACVYGDGVAGSDSSGSGSVTTSPTTSLTPTASSPSSGDVAAAAAAAAYDAAQATGASTGACDAAAAAAAAAAANGGSQGACSNAGAAAAIQYDSSPVPSPVVPSPVPAPASASATPEGGFPYSYGTPPSAAQ